MNGEKNDMALHNGRLYRTEDEIEHINGIGRRRMENRRTNLGRVDLLKLYLSACVTSRGSWAHLDKERIINHLKERISVES